MGRIDRRETVVHASHHQLYVHDSQYEGDTGNSKFWSNRACADRLAVAADVLAVGTASYGDVRVVVEVHDSRPRLRLRDWDHVTEASLNVPSGLLLVDGCFDESGLFFKLRPGYYRVRCCHAQRSAGVVGGVGGDWYQVQVWPARRTPPRVLKRDAGVE